MKNFRIYALRDRVADRFRTINLDINDFTAKRNFSYAVNNSPEMLFQAKDLELCCVGEFDDHDGNVIPVVPISVICRGDEVIVEKDS